MKVEINGNGNIVTYNSTHQNAIEFNENIAENAVEKWQFFENAWRLDPNWIDNSLTEEEINNLLP